MLYIITLFFLLNETQHNNIGKMLKQVSMIMDHDRHLIAWYSVSQKFFALNYPLAMQEKIIKAGSSDIFLHDTLLHNLK